MPLKVGRVTVMQEFARGQAEEQVMQMRGTLTISTAIKVKVGITLKLINCTYLQSASKVSFHSTFT